MITGPLTVEQYLARARAVHLAEVAIHEDQRELLRLLRIVIALNPFTAATSAAPGERGQEIVAVRRPRGSMTIPAQRQAPAAERRPRARP